MLNSNCGIVHCGRDSAQGRWLRADLAAHPRTCVAAIWHHPLFSSGEHGNSPTSRRLWRPLAAAGADLVLNGHDHDYERFAPQTADGAASADGMREFVVGTGGAPLRAFTRVAANSVARYAAAHGVLKLTLRSGRLRLAVHPQRQRHLARRGLRRLPLRAIRPRPRRDRFCSPTRAQHRVFVAPSTGDRQLPPGRDPLPARRGAPDVAHHPPCTRRRSPGRRSPGRRLRRRRAGRGPGCSSIRHPRRSLRPWTRSCKLRGNCNGDRHDPVQVHLGRDGSGGDRGKYRLQLRVAGEPWSPVALVRPAAVRARLRLAPGPDYQVRVRATNGVGTSERVCDGCRRSTSAGSARWLPAPRPLGRGRDGRTTARSAATPWFRAVRVPASRSRSPGREIAWIATPGTTRGSASVFLDDTISDDDQSDAAGAGANTARMAYSICVADQRRARAPARAPRR